MKTCPHNELNPYVDGELIATDANAMERHLAECAACHGEVAELRALQGGVAALPVPPLPDGFNERVTRAMMGRRVRRVWRTRAIDAVKWLLFGDVHPAPVSFGGVLRETAVAGGMVGLLCGFLTWLSFGQLVTETIYKPGDPPSSMGGASVLSRALYEAMTKWPLPPWGRLDYFQGGTWPLGALPFVAIGLVLVHLLRPRAALRAISSSTELSYERQVGVFLRAAMTLLLVAITPLAVFGGWEFVTTALFEGWMALSLLVLLPFFFSVYVYCVVVRVVVKTKMTVIYKIGALFGLSILTLGLLSVMCWGWGVLNKLAVNARFTSSTSASTLVGLLGVLPSSWVWCGVFVVPFLVGVVVAAICVLCGVRSRAAMAAAGMLLLAAGLPLVVLTADAGHKMGLTLESEGEYSAVVHRIGQTLESAAGLAALPPLPRTVLVVTSEEARAISCDLPAMWQDANVKRLQQFVEQHPLTLRTTDARLMLMCAATARWDAVGMWERLWDYVRAPGAFASAPDQLVGFLTRPEPLYHAWLDRVMGSNELVVRDEFEASSRLKHAYERQGDEVKAAVWRARAERALNDDYVTAAGHVWIEARLERDRERITVRNGVVEGRLFVRGKPASRVPVSLWGRHLADSELQDERLSPESVLSRDEEWQRPWPPTRGIWLSIKAGLMTRTDAQGRFRFTDLVDNTYVVGFLLDMPKDAVLALRASGVERPIEVTASRRHVNVGDIVLGGS